MAEPQKPRLQAFSDLEKAVLAAAGAHNNDLRAIYVELEQVAEEVTDDGAKAKILAICDRLRELSITES